MVLLGLALAFMTPLALSLAIGDNTGGSGGGDVDVNGGVIPDLNDGIDIDEDNPNLLDFIDDDDTTPGTEQSWELSDAADNFTGDAEDETIFAMLGGDEVEGEGGNDLIYTGGGSDAANGGAGDDSIVGDNGSDALIGGTGDDTITGDAGFDFLTGGSGDDLISGGEADDRLFGEGGKDTLVGGDGNDLLFGTNLFVDEPDFDTLILAGVAPAEGLEVTDDLSRDYLFGGAGDDEIAMGAGDVANGGEGSDSFNVLGNDYRSLGSEVSIIADFNPNEDALSIVKPENGAFPNIEIEQFGADTVIRADGIAVALLKGVAASSISQDDISFVEPLV